MKKEKLSPKAPVAVEEEVTKDKKDGKKKELRKHIALLKTQHADSTMRKPAIS